MNAEHLKNAQFVHLSVLGPHFQTATPHNIQRHILYKWTGKKQP
jgi:hypothetical protein